MRLIAAIVLAGWGFWMAGPALVVATSFTPSFQSARIGGGGLMNNIQSSQSDGTLVLSANTYGAYLYRTTGTCAGTSSSGWGTSYAAPCWEQLFTSQSVSGWTISGGSDNLDQGVLEIDACNNNTADAYAFFNGYLYVTTNLTGPASSRTWAQTTLTNSINGNEGISTGSTHQIACDPANPNVVYAGVPGNMKVSANGLSGASATFANVSGVGTTGTLPSLIAFDPNSSTGTCSALSGSPTCTLHFWVFTDGTGVYETYNGGTSFTLTSSGPTSGLSHMIADKFSQLWLSNGTSTLYKYVPNGTAGGGTWSTSTPGNYNGITALAVDPTSTSTSTERVVVAGSDANLAISTNGASSWTGVCCGGNTFTASGAQPPWMANANQNSGGVTYLATNDFSFDTSGNLWSAAGIGAWKMSAGSIANNGVWNAASVGIENLVSNQLISAPGSPPVLSVWDRGFFTLNNLDTFPSHYWPDYTDEPTFSPINAGWALTYASFNSSGSPCGSSCNFLTGFVLQSNTAPASSSDGGNTWTLWPSSPALTNQGGAIAAASPTNWIVVPGVNESLNYTVDGAVPYTITGISGTASPYTITATSLPALAAGSVINVAGATPSSLNGAYTVTSGSAGSAVATTSATGTWSSGGTVNGWIIPPMPTNSGFAFNLGQRTPLAADRVAANTYCAVDGGSGGNGTQQFFRSTTSPPVFTKVAGAGAVDGLPYNDQLIAVPGQSGHFFYNAANLGGQFGTYHLWKSTDTCATWTDVYTGLGNIYEMGFGAPKPGGSGYPAIYAYGAIGGVQAIWENDDGGTTTTWTQVPNSTFPGSSLDYIKNTSGDMNFYGRVYVGFNGSGEMYIDTATACPWIGWTSNKPNDSLTGTVTLTASTSGLSAAAISDVKFYVDGSLIGTQTSYTGGTGGAPRVYSQSWVTGGVANGAHTLTVGTDGNGCTANTSSDGVSIPITTH